MNRSHLYPYGGSALVALLLFLVVMGCGEDKKPTSPAATPPALSMALQCDNGLIDFTVTNPGGAMKQESRFIAEYADGYKDTLSVLLAHNDTLDCFLSNVHGAVRVTSEEWDIQDSSDVCLDEYFQSMIAGVNLSEMVPSEGAQFSIVTCDYTLYLKNLVAGGRTAELVPNDSGLTLLITFSNITADFYSPDPGGICPHFSGDVSISSVVISTAIRFDAPAPQVTLCQAQSTINGFHVNVDGAFGGIVSTIIGWLQNMFTDPLEASITQSINEWVGTDLSNLVIVNTSCAE